MNGQYPSTLLEKAVNEFAKLPGIGRKTAMRLVLHLLRQDTAAVEAFGNAIVTLKHEVKYCKVCHNISDTETCRICSNPQRDSSGTSHSAQYALAAMLKAANEDKYNFLDEVKVYGERARRLKEIFLRHGFHLVYDNDLGEPVADGFYFTIGYPGMSSGELAKELMYYGVSAISLVTTGSHQEGLRACTSFIQDHQYAQLDERMAVFAENHPVR